MKQKLTIFLTMLMMGFLAHAQDKKICVTVAYPLPTGDNFLTDYTGVADVGVQYRFIKAGPIQLGISANAGYYSWRRTLSTATVKDKSTLIQPRVFGELNLPNLVKFRPFMGIGYTFANFKSVVEGASNQPPDTKNNFEGINLNLGVAYDITKRFFAHVQYDAVKLSRDDVDMNESFFQNMSILKLGVGLRF